jgi:hypothetical protein
MPNPFPEGLIDLEKHDRNPAIQLFGRRFFVDQTNLEFLVEFLLVAFSHKRIDEEKFNTPLPPFEILNKWPRRRELEYAPKSRLNLKLFSFLGSSKLDTRHKTHREHLKTLDGLLKEKMLVNGDTEENVLKTLENLFLGFQGAGSQRTWCAQSFVPVCVGLISGESIWKASKARNIEEWEEALYYFDHNQALFLARGGEVLYLQICNALRQSPETIEQWAENSGLKASLTGSERNPQWLHQQLDSALDNLMLACPKTVTELAEFVDSGVESGTADYTDYKNGEPQYTQCGWCPRESWQEGYLFAVEILRLCRAEVDLMERLDLLEMACAMQVLRSLAMQADRHFAECDRDFKPHYRFAVSDPQGENTSMRQISRDTLRSTNKMIYDAVRAPDIQSQISPNERPKVYREADRRYGHKLFINIAKRIGLIIPRRGGGMRFVLNEQILHFLVMTLVPSQRLTYDSFKQFSEAHYGLAFDEGAINRANQWATGISIGSFEGKPDEWLQDMLEASGVLRRLSDSCALLENPPGIH